MSKHHLPPPTKFGPARPSQAKAGASAAPVRHAPPATRFGPAGLAQPRHGTPLGWGRAIPRMDPSPGTVNNPDDELVVYENLVLTKLSGKSVEVFATFLEQSPLFKRVLQTGERIKVITGFHGDNGDGGMPGRWAAWFTSNEKQRILSSNLRKFVDIQIIDNAIEGYSDESDLKNNLALDIVKKTSGGGRVFYAWCHSDFLFRHVNSGAKLMTF